MNADGMADEAVVPSTRVNKAATAVAESAEERDLTEGKYCRIGVDASDSEPEQVSIGASREITTGSVTVCRDRLTQRRSRMSQGSRTDLCGGRLATAVPTAILENLRRTLRSDEPSFVLRAAWSLTSTMTIATPRNCNRRQSNEFLPHVSASQIRHTGHVISRVYRLGR